MSLKNIAVEGMTVLADLPVVAVVTPDPATGTKTSATALVYRDGDTIQVSNITDPTAGATIPDPAIYEAKMISSATRVKSESVLVLLDGDESETIDATPQIPGSPPVDYPVSFKCTITVPGQIKAKAQ